MTGLSCSDFHRTEETLYRKKKGEFFLHGEGGGLTPFAEIVGNMKGYGEKIVPLTDEEAKKWVEEHLDVEDYIDLFGEPEE